ncbi:MAG TPA: hypothetical protein PLX06_03415 [Fimbriimonadaceae bacterium]|nr:hypothetical protein [Fimbriimonadaceae bacterium]
MRHLGLLGTLILAANLAAQTDEPVPMSRPDVSVVVKEHKMTADEVVITVLDPKYPPELLQKQILTLGAELKSEPRGLSVGKVRLDPNNARLDFVRGVFAVDGLIDRANGTLNLQPILRAFAAAPEPFTVENLMIVFDGEKPSAKTVKRHVTEAVEATATAVSAPPSVEYRVKLLSQDPAKLEFPLTAPEPSYSPKPSPKATGRSPLFYGAIALAALAAGALVYLALLRSGGSSRR